MALLSTTLLTALAAGGRREPVAVPVGPARRGGRGGPHRRHRAHRGPRAAEGDRAQDRAHVDRDVGRRHRPGRHRAPHPRPLPGPRHPRRGGQARRASRAERAPYTWLDRPARRHVELRPRHPLRAARRSPSATPTAWPRAPSSSPSGASCSPPPGARGRGSASERLAVSSRRLARRGPSWPPASSPTTTTPSRRSAGAWSPSCRSCRGVRCVGSPALCLAYVAAGRLDAFVERDATYAWDVGRRWPDDRRGRWPHRGSRRRSAQPRTRPRQRAGHQRPHPRRASCSPVGMAAPARHGLRPLGRASPRGLALLGAVSGFAGQHRPLQHRRRHALGGMPWPRSCLSISSSSGTRGGRPS